MLKDQIFSERLKKRRASMGYTQETLAAALGVNKSAVGNWESARNLPAAPQRQKISELLNVSQAWLDGETDVAEPPSSTDITLKVSERFLGELEGYAKLCQTATLADFVLAVLSECARDFTNKKVTGRVKLDSGHPPSSAVASALEREELPTSGEGLNRPPKS